jgi:hypothetical protein
MLYFSPIKRIAGLLLIAAVVILPMSPVLAQYVSPSYKVEETQFGAGGELDASSPSYKAQSSVGVLGVDKTGSPTYQAYSGFLTPNEPFLEMTVNNSSIDLGNLDASSAKTGTATFTVRAYTNSGYTVATYGGPPTSPSLHTIDLMATQGASVTGIEQFGINLRANTSPATFGADPSKQPDASFADGQAASGYNVADQFKYSIGDVIANTNTSGWGQTTYTISYIANINNLTEAGKYSMAQDLVVVPTY